MGIDPTRHGWSGWLRTEQAVPRTAFFDRALLRMMAGSLLAAAEETGAPWQRLKWFFESQADPNDWRLVRGDAVGVRYLPLTTSRHRRTGARERVLDVARRHPDRLRVELDALATRVLFDGTNRADRRRVPARARGSTARSPRPSTDEGERREVRASREVVLAGGAFNTPQLLMLSGVGPREELSCHGIPVRVDLPGVGRNLQDRYEVGVVNRMDFDCWKVLSGAKFARDDPQHRDVAPRRQRRLRDATAR